ncbi:MAG: kanamycin nucleotidyltransferase C-terminal domain-containing protein [Anaerolineales bacterium]
MKGPQPFTHDERLARAHAIANRFREKFGPDVLAIGLYGSLARGADGPYSDIEMFCVVRGEGIDHDYEWSEGAWKAEVNLYSPDTLLDFARELDEFWPLSHGALVNALPLYDPDGLFTTLREPVFAHSGADFAEQIVSTIVGELYEFLGKIRNAIHTGQTAHLAAWAVEMAQFTALVIGLANRHLYTASATLFAESLALPDRPGGYDALCELVTSGRLSDAARIAHAADALWEGLEAWAAAHGWEIHTTLNDLLE